MHIAGRTSLKDEQAKTQKHLCQVDVESVVYNKRTARCSSLPSWAPALPSDYTFQGTSVKSSDTLLIYFAPCVDVFFPPERSKQHDRPLTRSVRTS